MSGDVSGPVNGGVNSGVNSGVSGQAALLLLADTQLLFRPQLMPGVAQHVAQSVKGRAVQAAYVGAANGNQPAFHELAGAALESLLGCSVDCRFICSPHDIASAIPDVLLLAGGSVARGWEFLQQPAVLLWLNRIACDSAALMIGVSAGAIHLARGCDPEQPQPVARRFLDCYPHFIAVHEEQQGWPSRRVWQAGGMQGDFVGIVLGGGLWIQAGRTTAVGNASVRQAVA